MIVSFFSSNIEPWQNVLGTVVVMIASIGHIAWSIDMDIKNPTANLQGDEQASTVSKSTPKSVLTGLLIGFIIGLVIILMSSLESLLIPYLIILGASILFTLNRLRVLVLRIHMCYDKIEM